MTIGEKHKLTLEVTSVPDRDDVVVELWLGPEMMAELRHEHEDLRVQFYPSRDGRPWDLSYAELLSALQRARSELKGSGP